MRKTPRALRLQKQRSITVWGTTISSPLRTHIPMTFFPRFLSLLAKCALVSLVFAGTAWASDAKVVKIVGSGAAYYTPQGQAKAKIVGSDLIPEKSVIETGANVEVYIETFSGAVATVRQNSRLVIDELSATTRKARLNLKAGQVVSTLDPSKRSNTDYGIVMPTGVAAARGTVFLVTVVPEGNGNANTSVLNLNGVVRITRTDGSSFDVPFGQGSANSAAAVALAALVQSDPTVKQDIVDAVSAVAANVAAANSAAGSEANATAQLAAVTSAAVGAAPDQAGAIVNAAVQGAASAGSAVSGSQQATLNAVSAVTEAAVRAVATSNPDQVGAITQAAAAAVTAAGSATGASDAALTAAASAITSAAVNAAPNQAAAAAQGAAQGVVNGKITAAIGAAKAINPNLTTQELVDISNQVSASTGANAAVSAIATTATTSLLAATGQTGNTALAASTAATIAGAVNAGSSNGANTAGTNLIGASSGTIDAPQVTVNVTQGAGGSTVTATSSTGTTSATSSQTVAGNNKGGLITKTTSPAGTVSFVNGQPVVTPGQQSSTILPPLDQTQPVVSPAGPR